MTALADIYIQSPDWLKAVWALTPGVIVLALLASAVFAIFPRHRGAAGREETDLGELVCTVRRDSQGQLHIRWHGEDLPFIEERDAEPVVWR